jgi:hypothetical protein
MRFFKVATLCLDDSFAHFWHSLNQLHLECFFKTLEGVPTFAELQSELKLTVMNLSSALEVTLGLPERQFHYSA